MASQINAGSAFVELSLKNKMTEGLLRAKQALQTFGAAVAKVGLVFSGLSAAVIAPLTAAIGSLINSGKVDSVLGLWKELSDTLQVIAEELATAISPVLGQGLGIMNGIAIAASRWLKANGATVKYVVQIASGLGAVGAAMTVIGASASGIGSGFGVLAKIVPIVAAVLSSPLGIVVGIAAAIGAATYGWMRFTENGRAAAKMLTSVFAPAIAFIKTAVGGIGDALAAGDLELAGKIAVVSLQLVFLNGTKAIADAMGGVFGAFFSSVATDLIKGDFKGAWDTTLTGMAAGWDALAAGLAAAFKVAIGKIAELWDSLSAGISGTLSALSAVATLNGLDSIAASINKANSGFGAIAPNIKNSLVGISAASSAVEAILNRKSAEGAAKFTWKVAGGDDKLRDELEKKKAELAALAARAAKERAAMPAASGLEKLGQLASTGTTSSGGALALAASGGGGGFQMRIAKATEKSVSFLEMINRRAEEMARALPALVPKAH